MDDQGAERESGGKVDRQFRFSLRTLLLLIAFAAVSLAMVACVLNYGIQLATSDKLWMDTKSIGYRLQEYADKHGGRYPATLEDADFTSKLDANERANMQSLRPDYRQPQGHETKPVKLLVTQSRWETLTFYSDGSVESTTR